MTLVEGTRRNAQRPSARGGRRSSSRTSPRTEGAGSRCSGSVRTPTTSPRGRSTSGSCGPPEGAGPQRHDVSGSSPRTTCRTSATASNEPGTTPGSCPAGPGRGVDRPCAHRGPRLRRRRPLHATRGRSPRLPLAALGAPRPVRAYALAAVDESLGSRLAALCSTAVATMLGSDGAIATASTTDRETARA
ncbi:hypothetical protein NKG05_10495 [Oerskovia sp. M15]